MKISGYSVNIGDVAELVWGYGQDLMGYDPEEITEPGCDDPGGDIRLQVHDGWQIHTGLSDYDQDHRGYWGASWVPRGCSRKMSREIARSLIEQADEHFATS